MADGACIVAETSPKEDEADTVDGENGGAADGVMDWCAGGAPRLGKGQMRAVERETSPHSGPLAPSRLRAPDNGVPWWLTVGRASVVR